MRRDRQIATVIFILFEIVAIFLFAYFGIVKTEQASYENTSVISTDKYEYKHIELGANRRTRHYYSIWIDGEKYHLGTALLTVDCDSFQKVLDNNQTIDIRTHHNEIVEIYLADTELVSKDMYNANQSTLRVLAIILFSMVEVFTIAGYILYMIFHRTSKDKNCNVKKQ